MWSLTFLHSNDIHGRLDALARLTTVAQQVQAEAQSMGRTVFRWDAGDAFDRRFEECRLTRGTALPPVLTAAGVTVQTLGNDLWIAYGPAALTRLTERANYTLLAANLFAADGAPLGRLQSSLLVAGPKGLTVGVFGLTDPFRGNYIGFSHGPSTLTQRAQQLIDQLRGQGAQVVVFLSHLGLERDRELAQQLQGLALILGGHSHHLLPQGEWVGTTLIAQAGEYAEHLGRVDLDIAEDGTVIRADAQVLPIAEHTPPDAAVTQAIQALCQEMAELQSEEVGSLAQATPVAYYGNSPVANLVADALKAWGGAEIGLISGGAVQHGLPAGPVNRGHLGKAVAAPLNPVVSEVPGLVLRKALERAITPEVVSLHPRGLRGAPLGVPGLSGVRVVLDPSAPVGRRIGEVWINANPLEDARLYSVAHSDLEIDQLSSLSTAEIREINSDYSVLIEDIVSKFFHQCSPVVPQTVSPWQFIEQLELKVIDSDVSTD